MAADRDPNAPVSIVLSDATIVHLYSSYWQGEDLIDAIAISYGESSFDESASLIDNEKVGVSPGSAYYNSIDRGLFQINSKAHPEVSITDAYDASKNVYHAHRIWQQSGWGPWSSYWKDPKTRTGPRQGSMVKWIPKARAMVAAYGAGGTQAGTTSVDPTPAGAGTSATEFVPVLTPNYEESWPRAALPSQMLGEGFVGDDEIRLANGEVILVDQAPKGTAAAHVIGEPDLSLAVDAASQVTFELEDPELMLLDSGWLNTGAPLKFRRLNLAVDTVDLTGDTVPHVKVSARSRGFIEMRDRPAYAMAPGVPVSPTDLARQYAKDAGLRFIGQGSPTRPLIEVNEAGNPEFRWAVLVRLAAELGFIVFEANGILYWGKPSWLMTRHGAYTHTLRWPKAKSRSELTALKVPELHRTKPRRLDVAMLTATKGDVSYYETGEVEGTIMLRNQAGISVAPGELMKVLGIPTYEMTYLITGVDGKINGRTPVDVAIKTLQDPEPTLDLQAADAAEGAGAPAGAQPDPSAGVEQGGSYGTGSGWGWPIWFAGVKIISPFGMRNGKMHQGVDISTNDPSTGVDRHREVHATRAGTVVSIKIDSGGYGRYITLDHGGGYGSVYAHLSEEMVGLGNDVEQGAVIARSGSTGNARGPHLHFETRIKCPFGNVLGGQAVDPMPLIGPSKAK